MITSGTTTINPLALKDYTKEQVKELLKGKLADDFEVIYAKIRASVLVYDVKPKGYDKEAIKPIMDVLNDKAPTNSKQRKKS